MILSAIIVGAVWMLMQFVFPAIAIGIIACSSVGEKYGKLLGAAMTSAILAVYVKDLLATILH